MELSAFEQVAAILPSLLPPELGEVRIHVRPYGIKAWFGPAKPAREHYEAQVIGAADAPDAKVLAIEVGFHAENPKEEDNEAVLADLRARQRRWRKSLGDEAVAGPFLGRAEHWRRVSETWADPDLGDTDLAFELAARLTDYVVALEPVRRSRRPG